MVRILLHVSLLFLFLGGIVGASEKVRIKAYEAGFIKEKINIEALADNSFNTQLTEE